jgi:hypothetical protein
MTCPLDEGLKNNVREFPHPALSVPFLLFVRGTGEKANYDFRVGCVCVPESGYTSLLMKRREKKPGPM